MELTFSRYESEFDELCFIAKGGFGSVYRSRHKVDGCEYAIKKIPLKYCDPELFIKIFREVKTLARYVQCNHCLNGRGWSFKKAVFNPAQNGLDFDFNSFSFFFLISPSLQKENTISLQKIKSGFFLHGF